MAIEGCHTHTYFASNKVVQRTTYVKIFRNLGAPPIEKTFNL